MEETPAILTAAPFRGLPQPEAHGRRKFNDRLSMNQLPRRTLSRCVPAFNHVRRGGSCYSPTTRRVCNVIVEFSAAMSAIKETAVMAKGILNAKLKLR
ncbi:hypothetical protein H3D16_005590 [Escherichia coli]|nr:hypothetical protein [Escherichia coli]EFH2409209.1 hypothetical protein [Escherichia coli]EFU8608970.1 hypothetical protein [Escherichia coli]EKG1609728.1 hypothetical protein [Escherichia coli]EKZ2448540.1 hypothetical protein [Escherichia coli]